MTTRKTKPRSRAVATRAEPAPTPLQLIAEAARDPSVDIEKMRAIIALHKEMEADQARRDFFHHMSALQGEITQIARNAANDQTKSQYATYSQIDRALRPFYVKHGFSVRFTETQSERGPDWVEVHCHVTRGSHTEVSTAFVSISTAGPKGNAVMTPTHASGSAISYGRRYSLAMAFNIALADDDGNMSGVACITARELQELEVILDQAGEDIRKHLASRMKGLPLNELPQRDFRVVKEWLLKAVERRAQTKPVVTSPMEQSVSKTTTKKEEKVT